MQDTGSKIRSIINGWREKYDDCILRSPAGDEDVRKAEEELGRDIPGEYAEFLRCANGGEFFAPGTVFYGTAAGDIPEEMLLTYNNSIVVREDLDIPAEWIIIGTTIFEDMICINNDGCIAQWDMTDCEIFLTWDNIVEYLEDEEMMYLDT